jgi:superfamily II DNA or RNA helicase
LYTIKTDPSKRNRDQDVVSKIALDCLKNDGNVFFSCFTGYGKTRLGIYLSLLLGLKIIVLCHLKKVRRQWAEDYTNFCGCKIQYIKGNDSLDPEAAIYIIGITKASKRKASEFTNLGTVIIDESHMVTASAFGCTNKTSAALLKFQPRYLMGFSATPDRPDGLHAFFDLYFSPGNFIIRHEKKEFTVFKYQTPFKPQIGYTIVNGRSTLDWSKMIKSIENNKERWTLIANIVKDHSDQRIIILCNRTALSNGVYDLLKERKENVGLLIGSKDIDTSKYRVVVVGFKKGGVGLDDPGLSMAIIASDTKDVRQYEGRIRQTNNIIYHLVDNHKTFENHWDLCEEWYTIRGAKIKVIGETKQITKKTRKVVLVEKSFL